MRRQDEIRLLFPGQQASSQKFLLTELDRYAQAFDAEEILDLLRGKTTSAESAVAHQALVVATQFVPGFVARRYGSAQEQVGLWSDYHVEAALLEAVTREGREGSDKGRLRAAAFERMWPVLETLAAQLDRLPDAARPAALTALSLTPGAAQLVTPWLLRSSRDFSLVWTWASSGGVATSPERLLELLDLYGPGEPDLFLSALTLPGDSVVKMARRMAGRVDWRGVANLAQALGRSVAEGAVEALDLLSRETAAWGDVYVLRALELIRRPAAFDLLRRIHGRATSEFVSRQAVRAAGGFTSQQSIDFCREQLEGPESAVTAQALESLVRLRCPKDEIARYARRFLKSDHLRTRVNALLAVLPTETRLPDDFATLLRHADPLPRIEAAFCLGYCQTRSSMEALEGLATADAHPQVRAQAIKSLSKYQATVSLPVLTRIIESGEAADSLLASRVMSRLGGRDSKGLVAFFLRELARNGPPARRALLVSALAPLAEGTGTLEVEEAFSKALQSDSPEVILAALDGWRMMGGSDLRGVGGRMRTLLESSDVRVRTSAAVTGFLSGDLQAVDRLCDALRSKSPQEVTVAVHAALDLVGVIGHAVGPRFKALAVALPGPPTTMLGGAWDARTNPPALSTLGLEEGEFEVSQAGAARLNESLPVAPLAGLPSILSSPTTPAGVERTLPRLKSRSRLDVGPAVGQSSYLVAAADQLAGLETERAGIRVSRMMRQIVASAGRDPRPLAAAVVVVLVLVGGLVRLILAW